MISAVISDKIWSYEIILIYAILGITNLESRGNLMGRNYELKRIDEDVWEQTPEHIQKDRRRYSYLRDEIAKSNKKIEHHQALIRKIKTEKKEYEKE